MSTSTSDRQADTATIRRINAGELPDEAIRVYVSILRTMVNEHQKDANKMRDIFQNLPQRDFSNPTIYKRQLKSGTL